MKRTMIIGIFIALLLSPAINAAPDVLPGLWENKMEMSSKSGILEQQMEQAQKMLESMPPEQQQMMKDMMAKQGVSMNFTDRTVQVCLTQEQIDNFDIAKTEEGCSQSFDEESKDHYKLTMNCPGQNMSGSGDFKIQDNKHYSSTIVMNANINGQADTMTIKQEGRWLDSDCGDITPK